MKILKMELEEYGTEELTDVVSKKKPRLWDYCVHLINWKTFHQGKV